MAAKLDVAQISDITKVDSADTFERPIYAGNAIATVQSSDKIKVITVRGTGFDAAATTGGSAQVEQLAAAGDSGKSSFVGREVTKSDRPELTAAKIIVSGGRALGSSEKFQEVITPLADKLGAVEPFVVAPCSRIHTLITEWHVPPGRVEAYECLGLEVVQVDA